MNIHLVDVVGQYKKIKSEIDNAVLRVVESGQYILGKDVSELEINCAKYLNVKHAVGCASGTDALQVAMMALGIGKDDEVITTSFTFVATVETIALIGAKPVYVDVEADSFNMNISHIEKAITKKTKAIIPVHLFGQSVDMQPLMEIAKKHNLYVTEDMCQAIGAEYDGKKVGTFGDISCTSFFPSKNLGAFGDGGMMFTNNDSLATKLRMICNHGSNVRYYHELLGVNSRLDTIQAAILNVKLKYLDEWNNQRRAEASVYNKLFANSKVMTPIENSFGKHIYHQYTLRVERRDELAEYLKEKKIPFGIYYPVPLHQQKAFSHFVEDNFRLPVTEQIVKEVISLPMHTELTIGMQEYIAKTILEFYNS
ncbi:MAG: DegT/DnrJ/EryC1/StrS family aminotransferase [Ignavibacteriales bacterium]|nr:DegT/DnrJ/EryC1/StrS family aminotransferase [Ignavibacteriales bacterium]